MVVAAAPFVLPALGFGAGGVVAGSYAAAWHSSIGIVTQGSLFATLQSAGVVGLSAMTKAVLATGGATVGYVMGTISGDCPLSQASE